LSIWTAYDRMKSFFISEAYVVIKPTVWLQTGVVTIYGSSLDAAPHSHHAIQIVWPKANSQCNLNNSDEAVLAIIASDFEHQLQLSEGWILLIEPKSDLGQALSSLLNGQAIKLINSPLFTSDRPRPEHDLSQYLLPLLSMLNLKKHTLSANKSTVKDQRIQQILSELDTCLGGNCIKPEKWRAKEVAQSIALSESRFLHLFRDELGIAWRPYLLWRRMMCAIQAIIANHSATEAAHIAGFSDSAHLSRTFRRNFGMTIRQALTLFSKS